jgi:hypothetical protein
MCNKKCKTSWEENDMNELLKVYLNVDYVVPESLICKIDDLLLKYGWSYTGIANHYVPVDPLTRDSSILQVQDALRKAKWLKPYHPMSGIGHMTNFCDIDKVCIEHMTNPSKGKYDYYEAYYKKMGKLPHAIIVDENCNLVDGYISYLLAKSYNIEPAIMEVWSNQPIRKIVLGRHVRKVPGGYQVKSERAFVWIYNKKNPVVLGDLLQVRTRKGLDYIVVESISYVTGEMECSKYNKVQRHMGINIKEDIVEMENR